jgi:hypothetical protein
MNSLIRSLRNRWPRWSPPVGFVRFGSLRRVEPISRLFGFDRGGSIDRYYIEQFLETHSADIRGHVLEVADDGYTKRFGNGAVIRSDVLHISADNPKATIVADLTNASSIPRDEFDCIILTQTLQFIYDVRSAIQTLVGALRPGGVLLVTVSGISQISRYDMDRWGEYWRLTTRSARRLFEEFFPPDHITVNAHGNVLVSVAYLHGLTPADLHQDELDHNDPDYELLLTVRAVKPQRTDG